MVVYMTKERKAVIGTILTIAFIILCVGIREIGEFMAKLILGTFILLVGILVVSMIYNAIYDAMIHLIEWIDELKESRK